MSSVEQKIRELCKDLAASSGGLDDSGRDEGLENELVENTTQAILQIIEGDVIGGRSWHTCYDSSKCNRDCKGMIENDLRADQRANLREDK